MLHAGIDEAGYGPTLGPLVVATAWAEAADHQALVRALASTGVRDSKELHRPHDLAPLEGVALAGCRWATGRLPGTAAGLLALLGEGAQDRDQPWMQGADSLALPVAATALPVWDTPGVQPGGCAGRIIHPAAYNRFLSRGANKADLELEVVGELLCAPPPALERATMVDRLGGRKFYRDALARFHPHALVLVEEEEAAESRYILCTDGGRHTVAFAVGGESHSPLTALASCLAKYARELHMLLFNRWWCAQRPGLAPTAGYPEDARRWLRDLGPAAIAPHARSLVRGPVPG